MPYTNLTREQAAHIDAMMEIFTKESETQARETFKRRYSGNSDTYLLFQNFLEMEESMASLEDVVRTRYPDVRFWMISMLKICIRRGKRIHDEKEMGDLTSLPGYGAF